MHHKGISIFILSCLLTLSAIAQKNVYSNNNSNTSSVSSNYTANTVLFKIHPQFSNLFSKTALNIKALLVKHNVSIEKLVKVFPTAKKPERLVNHNGDTLVDLTLIYKLTYQGNLTVPQVLEILRPLPFFQYIEPEYNSSDELLYIPNDPEAQPGLYQFYLYRHRFIEAWDLTKGDTNVVIGVLDTGTELTHTDLAANIKYNWAEIPNNGIDDEGDGFVDNFNGWDTGDNDKDPNFDVHGHGVSVQGACSGVPDNNFGIAGGGFNCKAMPIKISNSIGALVGGYSGIYYAADHGCKVINLSWGGFGSYSQTSQNAINYAVINKDAVIVASAGNSDMEADFYPASYDHVLSVSGLDTMYVAARNEIIEKRTYIAPGVGVTYSFNVDLSAHTNGMSTYGNNNIGVFGGTSFSAPVVSGAAAIVRSYYPTMKADQVMELLRVSGSCLDSFPETMPISRFKMGRKLDVFKALTNIQTPSIRLKKVVATSKFGTTLFSGDTIDIALDLQNYLSKANNVNVRLVSLGGATLIDSLCVAGMIDSLQYKSNIADKFKIKINSDNSSSYIDLVFLFSDPSKNYYDFQGYKLPINPNYLDIDTNNVTMTIYGTGNIGYEDDYYRSTGNGFELNGAASMLYSGGLMIGRSTTRVSDCVRGGSFSGNQDFKSVTTIRYAYSSNKDMEASASFNDSLASSVIGVKVDMRAYANKRTGENDYVILEYKITNQSASTFDSLFVGLFADWDINNASYNRGDWDGTTNTLYTYDVQGAGKYAGITLLTNNKPSCFSLDNAAASTGGNINPNDDFTTLEKFTTIANGIKRPQAGYSGFGTDVSQVIGARILNLAPGQSSVVAYAIVGGDNLSGLLTSATSARAYFRSIKTGPIPTVSNASICNKDTVDINVTPSNGTQFKFYSNPTLTTSIGNGASVTLTDVSGPDTVYVVNADSIFDSNAALFKVIEDPMVANFQLFPSDTLKLDNGTNVFTNNTTVAGTSYTWDDGQGNTSTSTSPVFTYTAAGTYTIKLVANSAAGCIDSLKKNIVVKALTSDVTSPNELSNTISLYPNPSSNMVSVKLESSFVQQVEVEVFSDIGTKVMEYSSIESGSMLDFTSQPSGIYIAKIKYQDIVAVKRIVIQK